MINIILFIIIVLAIVILSIMYLKSLQVNTTDVKYNVVMRLLIVCLISIVFLENTSQTGMLKNVSGSIQTYLSDAGKTMMEFIDGRTKDIDDRLCDINDKINLIDSNIVTINEHIDSVNKNVDNTRKTIIETIQKYLDTKIIEFINSLTPLGPGGIKTIW